MKEASGTISGPGAFGKLKFESGIHRVQVQQWDTVIVAIVFAYLDFVLSGSDITHSLQRVPVTEKSGRVHTSAVSVAVLPQADEVGIGYSILNAFCPTQLLFICAISRMINS